MAKATTPQTSQEEPTRARPQDADGRVLDQWGLPLNGPARVRALSGRVDPAIDPAGWKEAPLPAAGQSDAADTNSQQD